MNFELTKRQEFVRKLVRRFVENEVGTSLSSGDH